MLHDIIAVKCSRKWLVVELGRGWMGVDGGGGGYLPQTSSSLPTSPLGVATVILMIVLVLSVCYQSIHATSCQTFAIESWTWDPDRAEHV